MSSPSPRPRLDAVRRQDLPGLEVRVDLAGGRLELSGHLDRRTAHVVHDGISALLQTPTTGWVVDASGLTGCDPTGLRALGNAYRRAVLHGRRLTLVGAAPGLHAALVRLRLQHHVLGTPADPAAEGTGAS